jgi:hypothetical protein
VDRRTLLRVLGAGTLGALAGCSAGGSDPDPSPTPTRTPPRTPTAAPGTTTRATDTPTPTASPVPTPTATSTSTPTPTPTPETEPVVVGLGRWAATETAGTVLEVQVVRWDTADVLTREELRSSDRNDAPVEPGDGKQWVIANLWLRNRGTEPVLVGPSQWTMVDLRNRERPPASGVMPRVRDALEPATEVRPNEGVRPRVVFAAGTVGDVEFVMRPYGDREGRTVRVLGR